VAASRISRVTPDGRIQPVAETGGGPNGLAVGPDGALYCCNNGGRKGGAPAGRRTPPPDDYTGGTIQRVNVSTGKVEVMLTAYEGRTFGGPNDIMFASDGSFWFTDFGKWTPDSMRHGGLYTANVTGSQLRQITYAISLNGIGLSPDEKTVYGAATWERWIMAYDTDPTNNELQEGRMIASFPGRQVLDSLAMEADGTIAVGCLFENPGIGRVKPADGSIALVPTPDSLPTNICFGGADMRTAYVTASERGALLKCHWPTPGLRLSFNL
jgi:gluconolactonase